ncbi:MAG: LuxR C-terminal-related transcriptional regulator [Pirellulales bacterium]
MDTATETTVRDLAQRWGFNVTSASDVASWQATADLDHPGCVLAMVDDPLPLLRDLENGASPLATVVLIAKSDTRSVVDAMRAGAVEVLEIPGDLALLTTAIEHACAASVQRQQRMAESNAAQRRLAQLSDGERDVLQLMLHGKVNKNIASRLGIALRTVEARRKRVFTKMGTRSLAEIAAVLQTSGLLAATTLVSLN